MPNFNMSISHSLSQEEALKRIKSGIDSIKKQYAGKIDDLQEKWNGNLCEFSLSAMGFSGSGAMNVTESQVEIMANLPFAAFLFKDKIEKAIRERMEQILG